MGTSPNTSTKATLYLSQPRPPHLEGIHRLTPLYWQRQRTQMEWPQRQNPKHLSPTDQIRLTLRRMKQTPCLISDEEQALDLATQDSPSNPGTLLKALAKYIEFRISQVWTSLIARNTPQETKDPTSAQNTMVPRLDSKIYP